VLLEMISLGRKDTQQTLEHRTPYSIPGNEWGTPQLQLGVGVLLEPIRVLLLRSGI
jgi:hypothetical protein